MDNTWYGTPSYTTDDDRVAHPHIHPSRHGHLPANVDYLLLTCWHYEPSECWVQIDMVPQHAMLVAGVAEVTTFAETLAVGLNVKRMLAEHRNTDFVRVVVDSDLYKISASLTSDRRTLVEFEVYCRHLALPRLVC